MPNLEPAAASASASSAAESAVMDYEHRRALFTGVERIRGRSLVCVFNFDRLSTPPIPGLTINFQSDLKEALFRVLKETLPSGRGKIDLCVYTRGGDTNAVWPVVSLVREFDPDFEVLVPFRCHSSGTLLALGAKKIHLTPLSELSPIDPSTGNQFNPMDPAQPANRLPISVEDVEAYRKFVLHQFGASDEGEGAKAKNADSARIAPFVDKLVSQVHPLALGNVHRVHLQIKKLGRALLELHDSDGRDLDKTVESLTTRFYSHLHMINRHEAQQILGQSHVAFADQALADALDTLLRVYEDRFALRKAFMINKFVKDDPVKSARFIGGVVESGAWSYLFETNLQIRQHSKLPPNVQLQLPPGQGLPLIPGLPREFEIEIVDQGWIHNKAPQGITTT